MGKVQELKHAAKLRVMMGVLTSTLSNFVLEETVKAYAISSRNLMRRNVIAGNP